MAFDKVAPGAPLNIPAETYNTFIDVANDFRARGAGSGGALGGDFGKDGLVKVYNNTGATVDQYGVMSALTTKFTEATHGLKEFKRALCLNGTKPSIATSSWRPHTFVVAQERIANGKFGLAKISGITPVKIDWISPLDRYMTVCHNNTSKGQSSPVGSAEIIATSGPTSRSDRWDYVRLGGYFSGFAVGKTTTDVIRHAYDDPYLDTADGQVKFYRRSLDGSLLPYLKDCSEAGLTESENVFSMVGSVPEDRWVLCNFFAGEWWITSAEC